MFKSLVGKKRTFHETHESELTENPTELDQEYESYDDCSDEGDMSDLVSENQNFIPKLADRQESIAMQNQLSGGEILSASSKSGQKNNDYTPNSNCYFEVDAENFLVGNPLQTKEVRGLDRSYSE